MQTTIERQIRKILSNVEFENYQLTKEDYMKIIINFVRVQQIVIENKYKNDQFDFLIHGIKSEFNDYGIIYEHFMNFCEYGKKHFQIKGFRECDPQNTEFKIYLIMKYRLKDLYDLPTNKTIAMCYAAYVDNNDYLQYAIDNNHEKPANLHCLSMCNHAFGIGFLFSNNFPLNDYEDFCCKAIKKNNSNCVEHYHSELKFDLTARMLEYAAYYSTGPTLQYLLDNNCPVNELAFACAAQNKFNKMNLKLLVNKFINDKEHSKLALKYKACIGKNVDINMHISF